MAIAGLRNAEGCASKEDARLLIRNRPLRRLPVLTGTNHFFIKPPSQAILHTQFHILRLIWVFFLAINSIHDIGDASMLATPVEKLHCPCSASGTDRKPKPALRLLHEPHDLCVRKLLAVAVAKMVISQNLAKNGRNTSPEPTIVDHSIRIACISLYLNRYCFHIPLFLFQARRFFYE